MLTCSPKKGCTPLGADKRVLKLATLLSIDLSYAIGIVESLRLMSLEYFPAGDVGKYTNQGIAETIWYRGDPDVLVASLTASGIVVDDPASRLRIKVFRWKNSKRLRRASAIRAAGGEASRKLRAAVYLRDGGRCLYCGTDKKLTLDHILPVSAGGTTTFTNLQTLCQPCNSRKKDSVTA